MRLRISTKLHRQLVAAAAASPDVEVCGLLIGTDRVEEVVPARNVATDPRRNFEIDPIVLFDAIRTERSGGTKILGYYHSHPTGSPVPSTQDCLQATGGGKIWLIIAHGRVTAWVNTKDKIFEPVVYEITE